MVWVGLWVGLAAAGQGPTLVGHWPHSWHSSAPSHFCLFVCFKSEAAGNCFFLSDSAEFRLAKPSAPSQRLPPALPPTTTRWAVLHLNGPRIYRNPGLGAGCFSPIPRLPPSSRGCGAAPYVAAVGRRVDRRFCHWQARLDQGGNRISDPKWTADIQLADDETEAGTTTPSLAGWAAPRLL